jgi:diaminopropionate ammonia-lyase
VVAVKSFNTHRIRGLNHLVLKKVPWTAEDATPALELIARCPCAAKTPLVECAPLAQKAGVGALSPG